MIEKDFAELSLFITGLTWIRYEARVASVLLDLSHRDAENLKRSGPIFAHLRAMARLGTEHDVILFKGHSSTSLEAVVRFLVARR